MKLSPSLLSADFSNLKAEIDAARAAGAVDLLHIDVMDGMFVPNISIGLPVVRSLRQAYDDLFLDVHLMVQAPERYITDFAEAGADLITVHQEAVTHLPRALDAIHAAGCQTGIALNPATPVFLLEYVLDQADLVLIMSVNPGFGGQKFMPCALEKLKQLRRMIDQRALVTQLQVDGGICSENIAQVLAAGADIVVAGSAVFGGDVAAKTAALRAAAAQAGF